MTPQRLASLTLSLVSLGIAGCSDQKVMCTMEARPALAVVVLDSITGAGLAGTTKAVVREGAFTDTLSGTDSVVSGVYERAGTYDVELSSPGYRAWTRERVSVSQDRCHVQTAQLRALLMPQ